MNMTDGDRKEALQFIRDTLATQPDVPALRSLRFLVEELDAARAEIERLAGIIRAHDLELQRKGAYMLGRERALEEVREQVLALRNVITAARPVVARSVGEGAIQKRIDAALAALAASVPADAIDTSPGRVGKEGGNRQDAEPEEKT